MFVIKILGDDYYIKATGNGHNEVTSDPLFAKTFDSSAEAFYYKWLNLNTADVELEIVEL